MNVLQRFPNCTTGTAFAVTFSLFFSATTRAYPAPSNQSNSPAIEFDQSRSTGQYFPALQSVKFLFSGEDLATNGSGLSGRCGGTTLVGGPSRPAHYPLLDQSVPVGTSATLDAFQSIGIPSQDTTSNQSGHGVVDETQIKEQHHKEGESAEDETAEDEEEQQEEERTRLFGPLIREKTGLTVEPIYIGEVFSNTRGGISTKDATQYEGLLDINMTLDFQQAGSRLPGRFFMLVQHSHGRGITEDFIGDFQVTSNIDTGDNVMQVSEYWWEIPLFDERLKVRVGKQDLSTEFLILDSAQDFIQSSFGISPTLAIPTFPHPSAALVLLAQPTDSLILRFGVWDGFPDGRNWGFSNTGLVITVGELDYSWALGGGTLPGSLDMGAGGRNSGFDPSGAVVPSLFGYYVEAEQMVFRENPADDEDAQGLTLLAQLGRIRDNDTDLDATQALNFGMVYQGWFRCRDDDVIGLGVAAARLKFGGTGREIATELFYKAQIRPWLAVQPDLQYVVSPSGIYRDALAVGMRFEIAW